MRIATALLALVLLQSGCGLNAKIKRLSEPEQSHYYALRVFMDEDQEKEYLRLKTQEERDAWLKANSTTLQKIGDVKSFWDTWYQYNSLTREKISKGEVEKGFTEDQVLMAWGAPFAKRRVAKRTASRSEIYVYRFEVDKDGNLMVWSPGSKATYKAIALYQYDVHIDDGLVTELVKKENWD